ncbi:hypothetical protein M9H77_09261 [Catharanthus roseus]|uniref:Uncharacterized protein n=1 Tax=Catharanthus roseus TaxID=4058 RepID=A0ACC0C0H9_CATRO|nr:hypothetical protein M9H77_09261 [Catharanthus roseus]
MPIEPGAPMDKVTAALVNPYCLAVWCRFAFPPLLTPLPGEHSSAPLRTVAAAAISSIFRAVAAATHLELAWEEADYCCVDGDEVDIPRQKTVLPRPLPLFSRPLPLLPPISASMLHLSVCRSAARKPTRRNISPKVLMPDQIKIRLLCGLLILIQSAGTCQKLWSEMGAHSFRPLHVRSCMVLVDECHSQKSLADSIENHLHKARNTRKKFENIVWRTARFVMQELVDIPRV